MRDVFGLPCVVAINHFAGDTEAENALLRERVGAPGRGRDHGAPLGRGRARRGRPGARGGARCASSRRRCASPTTTPRRCGTRCWRWPRASTAPPTSARRRRCARRSNACRPRATATCRSAWPRRSTASPPTRRCAARPAGHTVNVREVRLAAGAEFVVMVCGDIMTMPGLPKVPSAERIDLDDDGRIVGLS